MVNHKAATDILEAWRRGVQLREALKQFSAELDRAELLKRAKSQRRSSAIGKRKFRESGVNADQLLDETDAGLLRLSAAVQIGEGQKRQLIAALENGQLIALGYPIDRPKAIKPEMVPPFLIQLEFAKFGKSEFSDGETRYAHVRIIPGDALAKPKIGRPSVRDRVFEIASVLAKAGDIGSLMPRKQQAGKIQDYGRIQFPAEFTENRPSEQTIKRHVNAFWNSN